MSLMLVTYDCNRSEQDYSGFFRHIERYSNVRLSESSYAIITDKTPKAICAELEEFIDEDDNLYVITLKKPYDASGPNLASDWLKKELTY